MMMPGNKQPQISVFLFSGLQFGWVALIQAVVVLWSVPYIFTLSFGLKGQWYKEKALPVTDPRNVRGKAKPHKKNKYLPIIKEAKYLGDSFLNPGAIKQCLPHRSKSRTRNET